LADAGLTPQQANRCEQIASIPEEEFEAAIEESKEKSQLVAVKEVLKKVKRQTRVKKKSRDLEIRAAAAEEAVAKAREAGELPWTNINGDCVQELAKVEPGSVRLVFADPPYNIGIDYGGEEDDDLLDSEEYLAWVRTWLIACKSIVTPDGSMWVLINDKYAA